MRIRASKDTVICLDIKPSELRKIADDLEMGDAFHKTISIFGSKNGEGFELRIIPIKDSK